MDLLSILLLVAERLPETCRVVIPMKLEVNASVGFIHKERVPSCRILNLGVVLTRCC